MTADSLFKSLGIPDNTFNPTDVLSKRLGDWNVILSPRATGKTTNLLLWGMCLNQTDGTVIQYIRQYDDMLTPSTISDLFDVIIKFGYIEKITGGRYNSVKYWRRRWYYTKVDENGDITDTANEAFMVCLAINREHDLRSTYNAPQGDFIIVDEFMRADKMYIRDEFLLLCNLLSTIIRDRQTAHIFLVANLVDITCPYLSEMGIHDIVKSMRFGDFKQITADKTVIDIYLIPPANGKKRRANKYFALWQNARMTGITGARGTWALKMYPHAPHDENFKIIDRAQLECNDGYVCRELREYNNGLYVMFYPLNVPLSDRVTYTYNEDKPFDYMRRYGLGYTQTDKVVITLINMRKCFYSDNTTGERVAAFLRQR